MFTNIVHFDTVNPKTTAEAINLAKMDWDVKTSSLKDAETDQVIPGMINIRRVEKLAKGPLHNYSLGIMSTDYVVVPNEKLFAPFDSFLASGKVSLTSMGELKNGKVLYCQAQIIGKETLSVGNDGQDKVEPYITCYNSHDGSKSFGISQNQIRVVCQNTLMMSMRTGSIMRLVHKNGILEKVDNVLDVLTAITKEWQDCLDVAAKLRDFKINSNRLEEFVKQFMGVKLSDPIKGRTKGQFDSLMAAAVKSAGNNENDLSLWSAYNGVTHYLTHDFGRPDNRVFNNLVGQGKTQNEKAWQLANQMAGINLLAA